jgi:hypothetical protein
MVASGGHNGRVGAVLSWGAMGDVCPAVARKRYWSWLVTATWWPSTTDSGPLPC